MAKKTHNKRRKTAKSVSAPSRRRRIIPIIIASAVLLCLVSVAIAVVLSNRGGEDTVSEIKTDRGKFGYIELNDGTLEIIEYLGTNDNVVIPEKIDGKSVSSLADGLFSDYPYLLSIKIPSSVINIGHKAFDGCVELSRVDYQGSEDGWSKILIHSENKYLHLANINFNTYN